MSLIQANIFNFLNRVAHRDLRPVFNESIKPSLKNLIESCWSKDPDSRPTFEEIFKKLAYNSKDYDIDVFNDPVETVQEDFYMDGVDIEKVRQYANSIDNPELAEAKTRYEAEIANLQGEIQSLRESNNSLRRQQQAMHNDVQLPQQ